MSAEIYHLPKQELTTEQRQYWHEQAAYWDEIQEAAYKQLEYAQRQREAALRMLGMLAMEKGVE